MLAYIALIRNKKYLIISSTNTHNFLMYLSKKDLKLKPLTIKFKIIKHIKPKVALQFLKLINSEQFNKKKRLLIVDDLTLLDPQLFKLFEIYNIKVESANTKHLIIKDIKSLNSLSYKLFKEIFNIRQLKLELIKLKKLTNYLFDKKYIPFSIIQTLKKGYAFSANYYDINSAYPSSYKLNIPLHLSPKRTNNFIIIAKLLKAKGLTLLKDTHNIIFDNSTLSKTYNLKINKEKIIILHSSLYYTLNDSYFKPIKIIYFEEEDTYYIYKYLKELKERGISKSIINSVAFGFPLKFFMHVGLSVAQQVTSLMLKILKDHKDSIIDIYTDSLFTTKPIPTFKYSSAYTFKHLTYNNLIFIREGFIITKDLSTLRALSAQLNERYIVESLKYSNKMIIPYTLKNIQKLKDINKLYNLMFYNI